MIQPLVGSVYNQVRSAVSGASSLLGTSTAADVVFQRNAIEQARLTDTALVLPIGNQFEVFNVGVSGATDYEKGSMRWGSNEFRVGPEQGGTGSATRVAEYLSSDGSGLRILGSGGHALKGSAGGFCYLTALNDPLGLGLYGKITTGTANCVQIANNTSGSSFSASSSTQTLCSIFTTVNQSGSAAFEGLEVDITPTAVGSSTCKAFIVKRSGVEVFAVDVKATLTTESDTVMFLTYFSGTLKHARVTLAADVAGKRFLQVAT